MDGIAHPFSQFTDEQLLELSSQRDTLLDKGAAELDEELTQRGYDPDVSPAAITRNYERLFSSYGDLHLYETGKTRHTLSREGMLAFDREVGSRGLPRPDEISRADKVGQAELRTFRPGFVKSFFLRARSWKIFLLLFGIYVGGSVLQISGIPPAW